MPETSRDREREELKRKLMPLQKERREEFRSMIKNVTDVELLGDLRYDFGWDPDPRKSSWQAIEINRLITKRNQRRMLLPARLAIIISLASLVLSILSYLKKSAH